MARRIEQLLTGLASADTTIAARAESDLARLGDSAVDPLIEAITSPDARLRAQAAHTLGRIGAKRAFNALLAGLRDPDYTVKYDTIVALGDLQHVGGIAPLVDVLKDAQTSGEMASAAAMALTKFGSAAVMPLVAVLGEGVKEPSVFAAYTLGSVGDESAVDYLIPLAESAEDEVRVACLEAVALINTSRSKAVMSKYVDDSSESVRDIARYWVTKL